MTDFHSHILPKVDDGSRSVEESLKMLKMLYSQGVKRVVATPHFYANDESVESFLSRRQGALESISDKLTSQMPEIIAGAEVRYYEGIGHLDNLKSLRIGETELLLLEMPECKWTEYILRELTDISSNGRITPVLAHIERCIGYQSRDVFNRLLQSGILMQINAGYINNFFTRGKAMKMVKKGQVHFIGSDCHGIQSRPPDIGKAISMLKKKSDTDFTVCFKDFVNNFFE